MLTQCLCWIPALGDRKGIRARRDELRVTEGQFGQSENHKTRPNPSIRGVGAPMEGLSALPWTARWCQGTLP